jgi:hypothetical protein
VPLGLQRAQQLGRRLALCLRLLVALEAVGACGAAGAAAKPSSAVKEDVQVERSQRR